MEWPDEPSSRYVFHWLFRRKKLCPGPQGCDIAKYENGGTEPCPECAGVKLDEFLNTVRGRQIALVTGIDRAIQAGITYGPHDLTYPEFLLLRVLAEERDAFSDELLNSAKTRR